RLSSFRSGTDQLTQWQLIMLRSSEPQQSRLVDSLARVEPVPCNVNLNCFVEHLLVLHLPKQTQCSTLAPLTVAVVLQCSVGAQLVPPTADDGHNETEWRQS